MKKSTKVTLIVSAVLMLVGGIVALICLLLEGSLDDVDFYPWMNKGVEIEIENDQIQDILEHSEDLETWDFAGEEIHSLELDIEAGTLYIQSGEDYMVAVENDRNDLRCHVKNGVLTVKETDSIHTLVNWNNVPTIILVIPEGTEMEMAHVTVGAGNVQVQSLQAEIVELDVDAGNVTCKELQVQECCRIDVDAGNVSVYSGQIEGGLEIDVDAGMVSYEGSLARDWKVDCDAGNVEMVLDGVMEDFDYDIEYDLGTVKIGNREFEGMSDQVRLSHGSQNRGQIQCNVGQVEIRFQK